MVIDSMNGGERGSAGTPAGDGDAHLEQSPSSWVSLLQQDPQKLALLAKKWLVAIPGQDRAAAVGALWRIYSQALAASGEIGKAFEIARQAERRARRDGNKEHFSALLFLADILHRQGRRQDCHLVLAKALASGCQHEYFDCQPWLPAMMARLCGEALEAGIETDYVRQVIRRNQLFADGPDRLRWPWPVRIYTLGRFAIAKNDQPLSFSGKSPHKPLELLQVLIALGGREVHISLVIRNVWPDEDSLDQRKLFDNTLLRLRRILGSDQTLLLHDAKLTLDCRYCWVDAWAFDHLARKYLAGDVLSAEKTSLLLHLYQGHFLARDAEQGWLMGYRDSLRSRFQQLIRVMGGRLEEQGQWQAAAAIYERGLEVDNLAENFYRGLMICHQRTGEHAEALRVYRRCRELLSVVLGVAPSPATESVRLSLEQESGN